MRWRDWKPARPWGWVVGASVTLSVTLVYLAGGFDRLTLACLDLAFRHLNRIEADDRIVLIDIDDPAIEQVGRWPWPRRRYAQLIDTLAEAEARAIVVDIVFAEPQKPRLDHPALAENADIDPPRSVFGEVTLDDAIHDDDELAAAIERAGNVYLAMFCKLAKPGMSPEETEAAARKLFRRDPDADLATFRRAVRIDPDVPVADQYDFWRLAAALEADFGLGTDALAARLKLPADRVERRLGTVKDRVARRLASDFLDEHPDAAFHGLCTHVLPGVSPDDRSADRAALVRAYRAARAVRSVLATAPESPASLRARVPHAWDLTPPLDTLAAAAGRVGFVTFEPDEVDGVLRRIPAVSDVNGRVVPHLGLAIACDLLDVDETSFAIEDDAFLTFADRVAKRHWRVPLDNNGRSLINWHVDPQSPGRWDRTFVHVPAGRVMEVPLGREAMRENDTVLALTWAQAVAVRFGADQPGYAEYASHVRERNRLRQSDDSQPEIVAETDAKIRAVEKETLDWIAYMCQTIEGVEPESDEEAAQFATYRELHAQLAGDGLAATVKQKNAALEQRIAKRRAELHAKLDGKVCFVGYTATAVADTVNSPVFENMPGVLAHANVLNMVVQNRFPRVTSRGVGAVLILLCGLAVTVLTSSRGPWVSLIGVLLVIALVAVPAMALFSVGSVYVSAVIVAIGGVFVAWAFITLFRQIVEEKQRRLIAKSLARQTSPAIAAQIAHGKTEADFVPQPADVTCYFSDLQGFTTLSEAIGPERTKEVLNRYLGAMSDVLLAHRGSSKFMGDGIFAYFNAPIWACADHAVAGCEAAIECLDALARLKQAEAGGEFKAEFDSLVMRAGLHTGPAFAGIYGSGDRVEYTCIGDTVNLAARLEAANKLFGTRALVSESCQELAGDRYVCRDLGRLLVKGKTRPVRIAELLGRTGEVGQDALEYADSFAQAVEQFQQRNWERAEVLFLRCRDMRDDDPAIALYCGEIDRLRTSPPPADWHQSIEMITK